MKSRLRDVIAFVLFLLIVTAGKGQAATVIYAATQNGTYKSADGGLTWKPITVNSGNSFLQGVPNLGASRSAKPINRLLRRRFQRRYQWILQVYGRSPIMVVWDADRVSASGLP
jgi:hypothetical protein